ncbi:MAG: hypothetical protein HC854_01930 [Flavobacterium sp.]|nr:hypothetical protein [Flavobacterium sp.]
MNFFEGREIVIATQHKKELVIQPLLEKQLGLKVVLNSKFNTDSLGTFCGEKEREEDALKTLRKKCLLSLEKVNFELVVATEGSFGPHPSFFFAATNDELILLLDKKNNLEILAREITTETNFNSQEVKSYNEVEYFATKVQFPSHGLILKSSHKNAKYIKKGIITYEDLEKAFLQIKSEFDTVIVETDMRAMFNPTRMKVIENVTHKLIAKIKNLCPNCNFPGFDVVKINAGLPCELCNLPTKSTLSHLYKCKNCDFEELKIHPNNKSKEDPTYCDYCNP